VCACVYVCVYMCGVCVVHVFVWGVGRLCVVCVVCVFVHACKVCACCTKQNDSISELIADNNFKLWNTVLTWHSIPH